MIRKDIDLKASLRKLGLTDDDIEVYLVLLRAPASPLGLSRETGIKRTKVYGLLDGLEKRSLIARQIDERGTYFVVTEPVNLGIQLSELESKLKEQQETFQQIIPILSALRGGDYKSPFTVRTYEGAQGFKQMLWHELKSKSELLSLGGGDVEELIASSVWAARYRARAVDAGYRVREIVNSEIDLPTRIDNPDYLQIYTCRGISARVVTLENQITVYNDTVAIYNWRQDKKMGVEVMNRFFAQTMRSIFEHFWKLTEPATSRQQ